MNIEVEKDGARVVKIIFTARERTGANQIPTTIGSAIVTWTGADVDNVYISLGADGTMSLNKRQYIILRTLMQHLVTETNNPPVGCEPV